ncbi:MAG: hypothetical protein KJ621_04030 [Proteobacteria bacterium]|nr:hypothetical protein [Pseudomonadota bacterium]
MATVTVSFTLDSETDRDLVRWLAALPRRQKSAMIRDTLRVGLARGDLTLGDVYQAIKEVERKLARGVVVAGGAPAGAAPRDWPDEPADAAAALDALSKL